MNLHGLKFSCPVSTVDIDSVSLPLMREFFLELLSVQLAPQPADLPSRYYRFGFQDVASLEGRKPFVPGVQTWLVIQTIEARDKKSRVPRHSGF